MIEAGTFYNVYHCPNCHRKFGRPTALKTGLKVAKFMVVGALVLGGVIDADDVADATDA